MQSRSVLVFQCLQREWVLVWSICCKKVLVQNGIYGRYSWRKGLDPVNPPNIFLTFSYRVPEFTCFPIFCFCFFLRHMWDFRFFDFLFWGCAPWVVNRNFWYFFNAFPRLPSLFLRVSLQDQRAGFAVYFRILLKQSDSAHVQPWAG